MSHLFYEFNQTRKAFVVRATKNEYVKKVLTGQNTDDLLFGADFADQLKKAKIVQKAAHELGSQDKEHAKKRAAVQSFLRRRASHPYRRNEGWSGQGSQKNRWTYGQSGFPFNTNAKPRNPQNRFKGHVNSNNNGSSSKV